MTTSGEFDINAAFQPSENKVVALTTEERAAHELPRFEGAEPTAPILYLPPLLSSLPKTYHDEAVPEGSTSSSSSDSEDDHSHAHAHNYTETHLPSIDPVSLSLHRALHKFQPLDDRYANVPYGQAFNWSKLELPLEEEREWYCVAFRSRRQPGSESEPLYHHDRLAHEEAVQNGGLLMYWYGVPDPRTGLNLATCIWQSRRHARLASSGPQHILAMRLAASSFAEYRLERYVLKKEIGKSGLTVETYVSGEVGW